jgi:hypothetical protein
VVRREKRIGSLTAAQVIAYLRIDTVLATSWLALFSPVLFMGCCGVLVAVVMTVIAIRKRAY